MIPVERSVFVLAVAVALVASVQGIAFTGLTSFVAFAIAVAVLGLPHGALDAAVARRTFALRGTRDHALFVAAYVVPAFAMGALFLLVPLAALVAFLCYSAVHFGQDWSERLWRAAIHGAAVLALPAWHFETEVASIFTLLAGDGALVAGFLHAGAPLALIATLGLARHDHGALVEIGAYTVLALTVPPHVAFAVYFVALHSPRHFRATTKALDIRPFDALAACLPFVLGATAAGAVGVISLLGSGYAAADALARAVFIGLACLTVPHMVLDALAERLPQRSR